ncbi:MAG: tRNA-intron lyase [Thermoplasmatota archaeon]
MKPAKGTLNGNSVIVTNTKDVGRLYTKSRFGTPQSDNQLHLSLIEAAFLLDEKKLLVFQNNKKISFEQLITHAAKKDSTFETTYIIFQNLRNRGQQITLCKKNDDFTFNLLKKTDGETEKQCLIIAFSERSIPSLTTFKHLITQANKQDAEAWIAIADEEGDVTYYLLSEIDLHGTINAQDYQPTKGLLLQDRVIVFDEHHAQLLHQKEFFGKPFGNGLQLSLVEAAYLVNQQNLSIIDPETENNVKKTQLLSLFSQQQPDIELRITLFNDLKQRGMLVKTGFKFGTHFRAYTQSPNKGHAEYLIHGITDSFSASWPEISRAIRLAHSVNKTFAFAIKETNSDNIYYISLSRLRP